MSDRFNIEEEITNCWNVVSDLRALYSRIDGIDENKLWNIILGLADLYELKFQNLQETFEKCISNGGFVTPKMATTTDITSRYRGY